MKSIFQDFQSLSESDLIWMQNKYLDEVFKKFSFYLINKYNDDLIDFTINKITKLYQKTDYKNIFILEYIEEKQGFRFNSNFFFLCFENTLIIFEISEIKRFYAFLSQCKESKIFILSENNEIINQMKSLQLQIIKENENQILKSEMQAFKQKLSEKVNKKYFSQFKNIKCLFEIIKETISGFLIEKSYCKINEYDRVLHFKEYQEKVEEEKTIEKDSYIILHNLGDDVINAHLIYDIKREEIFTLKMFFNDEDNEKKSELFERERKNYLNIHHPLFPKYLGTSKYFSNECIIIEYIKGYSLDNIINMKLNKDIKLKIIFQILVAFDYLHYKGFIYRDLKPNNIIFNDKGSITIIDFDRMIDNNDDQSTKNFCHKYIAPEFKSDKGFTAKSDIYSIGKIIGFVFEEEFSHEFISEYSELHEIYENCINIDETKRPNISDLVMSFYLTFISKKINITDNEIIQSINNIENKNYFYFWFLISEYDHQLSKNILKSTNNLDNMKTIPKSNDQEIVEYISNNPQDINQIINYLTSQANQNDSEAQYILGMIYGSNSYVPQDINKTIYYFTLAANNNKLEAQLRLGFLYLNGNIIPRDINKAIHYFTLAANQNFPEAQYTLGLLYITGKYCPQNINKAIHYLSFAADQNHQNAQCTLGSIYSDNKYIPADFSKAIHYFTLAANQNNFEAQFTLGTFYEEGKIIPRDINKAIHYFTLAANQNHLKAQEKLGTFYYYGTFLPKDIKKAIHYYTLAANQNDSKVQYALGLIYYKGEQVPQDINKAIYYFTLAANQNHLEAQFNLGILYEEGIFITRNINKAIYYYTLAANQNLLHAQYKLGSLYEKGKFIPQDINKAIHYYTLAANQNDSKVQYIIGLMYYIGKSIPKDINKAIYYFTLAANQNHSEAQEKLGLLYYEGKFIQRDINKAIYYFTLAANQNHSEAQDKLGLLYYKGIFIQRDINKAIYYFTLAAKQNKKKAQFYLGYLFLKGEHIPKDINKAIHYYTLSADQNYSYAQYNLGLLYYTGEFITQNINKAIHYLTLAANQNNSIAQYSLGYIYFYSEYIKTDIKKAIHYFTLSSKLNNPKSLMMIGFFYYYGKYFTQSLNKSIYYFTLAAENDWYEANYYLGCIYCQMNVSNIDFDKIIKYFKQCSSFNHQYSKNNLGLLYKNVKRNEVAIEYLKEAIHQKNDKVSMYNLGHIYFYGKFINENIDESIELLTKSAIQSFDPSKFLLCLAIIQKISTVNFDNIKDEIEKYGVKSREFHLSIYELINKYGLDDITNYSILYEKFEKIEYFYNFDKKIVQYDDYIYKNQEKKTQIKSQDKFYQNITKQFYDGFGF